MTYEDLGRSALDYFPCRYGKSKLLFRGPKRKLEGEYVAVLGGSETYGKFVERPFPVLTEELLGRKVVNFGVTNAGLDVFAHDPTIQDACSRASVTVIQIGGAQNMSNRFYAVHPRRNDRFLRASTMLKTLYRDIDFTEFNFMRHLLTALKKESAECFAVVEQELKVAWTARMKTLVSNIESDVVLLWMSDHGPDDCVSNPADGTDPLFVDRAMLREVSAYASGVVEVIVGPDEIAVGRERLLFSDFDEPAAMEMLGVGAHEKAAAALHQVLATLM